MENWKSYHRVTRTGTYGFLMAIPLLILYEVLIRFANEGRIVQVRVGAEVWIKQLLASIGAAGSLILSAIVLIVGVAIILYERKRSIPIRPRYFGWMVAESMVYAIVVAFFVSQIVGIIFAAAPAVSFPSMMLPLAQVRQGMVGQLALSIGAGLYEEFLFRVLLVGGLFWVFKRVFNLGNGAYALAAVIGALIFSGVHYTGALGDPFALPSFTFRFLFGLVLNVLYLVRGFGIAAWTHALYDVLIVTHLLG